MTVATDKDLLVIRKVGSSFKRLYLTISIGLSNPGTDNPTMFEKYTFIYV
jgi:hypothetical protein